MNETISHMNHKKNAVTQSSLLQIIIHQITRKTVAAIHTVKSGDSLNAFISWMSLSFLCWVIVAYSSSERQDHSQYLILTEKRQFQTGTSSVCDERIGIIVILFF